MLKVNKLGVILNKTTHAFECEGVLNPAVIKVGDTIHMFYRAVAKNNYSTIGYCTLSAPMTIETRNDSPLLSHLEPYELKGLEDPRIVEIDGTYYLSYTAFDGINALGALATSTDLINWVRLGIIVPQITYDQFLKYTENSIAVKEKYVRFNEYQKSHQIHDKELFLWDKNLIFFPRKINNKFCFLHRIKPDIQIVVSVDQISDLTKDFWEKYFIDFDKHVVLSSKYPHEVSYLGGGCPPIETADGWLIIYHGVFDSINGYIYSACAALLDLEDPNREIARLPYPLFSPRKEWELKGEVNNVCFPTGAVTEDDDLYIYYGAADERIAVASMSIKELLAELKLNKI
jgi:predicted GH43/DUF377 family glycosyl hydrolase